MPSFTIRQFIMDNFRMFTIIGTTGTMVSLIPAMGTRVLGQYWISSSPDLLPLIMSLIIFFGGFFLTICFLIVFSLVFQDRGRESVLARLPVAGKTAITVYKGDLQRFILMICLLPMWLGILVFFVLLMPLIPNDYSWAFSAFIFMALLPIAVFAAVGWVIGKAITRRSSFLSRAPRASIAAILLIVLILLVAASYLVNPLITPDTYSSHIRIQPAESYYSPHLSSAKGLKLEITNFSGSQALLTRHTWSASYGYFLRVVPSTSEVMILGNPATDTRGNIIYWTWSDNGSPQPKEPVKIDLVVSTRKDNTPVARTSLNLTWFDRDIVFTGLPP